MTFPGLGDKNRKMSTKTPSAFFFLFGFLSTLILPTRAAADISIPTTTDVRFTENGQAVKGPVTFTVSCRGRKCWPGRPCEPAKPASVKIYSFSGSCKSFPCQIHESYYLNYTDIDRCDIEGENAGKKFSLPGYSSSPINFGTCTMSGAGRRCKLEVSLSQ